MRASEIVPSVSVDSVDRSEWNNVAEQSSLGSVFQRYEFVRALERGSDLDVSNLVLREDGNLKGFMTYAKTRFGVSSLDTGYGGPVAVGGSKPVEKLIEKFSEISRYRTLEISPATAEFSCYNSLLEQQGFDSNLKAFRMMVELDNRQSVIDRMSSSRRSSLREDHSDVEIYEPDREDLIDFYSDYRNVRQEEELIEKNIEYFESISEMSDRLLLAQLGNEARILCLKDGETLRYVWGTRSGEGRGEMLHLSVIDRYLDNFSRYSLGLSKPDYRDGLYRFKSRFGAESVPVINWRKSPLSIRRWRNR